MQLNNQFIFSFSDTHGNHSSQQVLEDADIIICAGDTVEVLASKCFRDQVGSVARNVNKIYKS